MAKSLRNLFSPTDYKQELFHSISVEISSICNAKCLFCSYRLSGREKRIMSLDFFKKSIDSCREIGYTGLSITSMGGDPFTNKQAVEMIEYATNQGFSFVEIYTNGIALGNHDIKRFLHSGINHILISFPGFDASVYVKVFGVDAFSSFQRSIELLLRTHKKEASNVRITFEPRSCLTVSEIKRAAFYKDVVMHFLGDNVNIGQPTIFFDDWCGVIKQADLLEGMKLEKKPLVKFPLFIKRTFFCSHILNPGIMVEGDVRLCNCRYDIRRGHRDELYIGNLHGSRSLREFFRENEAKIRNILGNYYKGIIPVACSYCPNYLPVKFSLRDIESLYYLKNT